MYFSEQQMKTLFNPLDAITFPFDGIYLDELSGWWLGNANFNKAHYQYTTVPLTYSPYYKKPMLHRASTTWELVKKLSDELHSNSKTIFANKCPDKTSFYTPLIDAMGTEQTALSGSVYSPQTIEQMSMWRTLSYQKPFCILLSNDYDVFDHDMMEKYFQQCLAFGIFPSPSTNYSDNLQYFTSRNMYYERDRDLWKKYMPALKTVAEAGWEPVTEATADNSNVLVERYGKSADYGVYFTLFNNTDETQDVNLTVPVSQFGLKEGCTYKELTSLQPVSLQNNVYKIKLQPNQTVVLAINNPKKDNTTDNSSTNVTIPSAPARTDMNTPNVPTGETSCKTIPYLAIMAAMLATGSIGLRRKFSRS
jgi:hypothetical protein